MLAPGGYSDVQLQLSTYVAGDQTVYAMLHYDDPADGKFTFPQNGDPAVTKDGKPLLMPLTYTMTGSFTPGLTVTDQTTDGSSVIVPRATIDGTGWLVIHPEASGGGPNGKVVLAKRMLQAGTYGDVTLDLADTLTESQTLYAMLHYDHPADGKFTFPQNGDPAVTKDGSPVLKPFSLTVQGGGMSGGSTTVEMKNTAFSPVRASVSPGTTVTWVNHDSYGHTVESATFDDVATDWNFKSGTLGQGETATHTFTDAGVYEYYCSIHGKGTMCGAILVGDVSLDQPLPCEM